MARYGIDETNAISATFETPTATLCSLTDSPERAECHRAPDAVTPPPASPHTAP